MIRYSYNRQCWPPAPFVYVSLRCPETGRLVEKLPAQVDPGADRTVIPERLVGLLDLVPLDKLWVEGLGGQGSWLSTYRMELILHDLSPQLVEVFAHAEESHILLGRDVLNQHRLLLDGPGLALEIL